VPQPARGPPRGAPHAVGPARELSLLREVVREALAASPDRAAAVDNHVFGYVDMVADMRARGSTEPTPKPPADPNPIT
jgi:hypothetical protein